MKSKQTSAHSQNQVRVSDKKIHMHIKLIETDKQSRNVLQNSIHLKQTEELLRKQNLIVYARHWHIALGSRVVMN